MTDLDTGAGPGTLDIEPTPDEAAKTTTYLVLAFSNGASTLDVSAWEEVGVIEVPARTRRPEVCERAKEKVGAAKQIMVIPVAEITQAVISMETPPPVLTVKMVDRDTGEVS